MLMTISCVITPAYLFCFNWETWTCTCHGVELCPLIVTRGDNNVDKPEGKHDRFCQHCLRFNSDSRRIAWLY